MRRRKMKKNEQSASHEKTKKIEDRKNKNKRTTDPKKQIHEGPN